jgi:hypothetical protein
MATRGVDVAPRLGITKDILRQADVAGILFDTSPARARWNLNCTPQQLVCKGARPGALSDTCEQAAAKGGRSLSWRWHKRRCDLDAKAEHPAELECLEGVGEAGRLP